MKVRTILLALPVSLAVGLVGCQSEQAPPRPEQPAAGVMGTNVPEPALRTSPAIIGVHTMHADDGRLAQLHIGILATDGFEQAELVEPRQAYASQGATTVVVSPMTGNIQGYRDETKGDLVKVDMSIVNATPAEFDALLVPGGILNGDKLRLDPVVIAFVRSFARSGKPLAVMGYGLWPLLELGGVRGRTVTSCPSLRTDLKNAGATWVDQAVVVDRNLVTSRGPDDVPAFNAKTIDLFATRVDHGGKGPAVGGGPRSTD